MAVAYERSRLMSFIFHGAEQHLAPVVARIIEVAGGCPHLSEVKPLSLEEVSDLQDGQMGDVNVANIVAIADSLAAAEYPAAGDEQSLKVKLRSLETLTDMVTLVSIADKFYSKSDSWTAVGVGDFLGKCGLAVEQVPPPAE